MSSRRFGLSLICDDICASVRLILFSSILFVPLEAYGQANEQAPYSLGSYGDWSVWEATDEGMPVCYITSTPEKREPEIVDDENRSAVVFVSRSINKLAEEPEPVVFEQVYAQAGYVFDEKSIVKVMIGQSQFNLKTSGYGSGTQFEEDWPKRQQAVQAMLQEMSRSETMTVEGISESGVRSLDTYSLISFDKAYLAMAEACPN